MAIALTLEDFEFLAKEIAPLVAPHLQALMAPKALVFEVLVARLHRLDNDGAGPLAFADLTFRTNGQDIGTVPGFKLIRKPEGGVWLAVPQHKSDTPNADGTVKWLDNFKWGSEAMKTQARRVVKDQYDQGGANAPS